MGSGPGMQGAAPGQQKRKRTRLPSYAPATTIPIHRIEIIGNERIPDERIAAMLHTREGRFYDPDTIQRDVRTLIASGMFQDVRTYKRDVGDGKSITFEVVERPTITYVRFIGNERISDKKLHKEVGLKPGDPLNGFTVEESRRRLHQFYVTRGFADAHVEILEGQEAGQRGVAFQIHEGGVQRIYKVAFVGNTIASNARLKTQITSKPGILWMIGGKVKQDAIDQDIDRLTAYYRSLGYFRARVGRKIEYNADRDWITLTFVIDEGDRYRIREIRTEGNAKISTQAMLGAVESKAGEFFNLGRMMRDVRLVRDHYGTNGYIFADVQAEPEFQEEPGQIDIVFKIDEGEQYRVGRVLVNIEGDNPHTRQSVVLNHLSIRPGDLIDITQLRSSERRLQNSKLFMHDPASGVTPKIVVRPPRRDESQIAGGHGNAIRGQSPPTPRPECMPESADPTTSQRALPSAAQSATRISYRPALVDLVVTGRINPAAVPDTFPIAHPSARQAAHLEPLTKQPPVSTEGSAAPKPLRDGWNIYSNPLRPQTSQGDSR